jgi:hypothetical protein
VFISLAHGLAVHRYAVKCALRLEKKNKCSNNTAVGVHTHDDVDELKMVAEGQSTVAVALHVRWCVCGGGGEGGNRGMVLVHGRPQ